MFRSHHSSNQALLTQWLTTELKSEVRSLFESRYKRKLTDDEVVEIADNLASFLEVYLKLKWKAKYEKH